VLNSLFADSSWKTIFGSSFVFKKKKKFGSSFCRTLVMLLRCIVGIHCELFTLRLEVVYNFILRLEY
jgi:hypothetical protein